VRLLPRFRLLMLLGLLLGTGRSLADEPGLTRDLHAWGRFYRHTGAWKRYRVTTETLDEKGAVVNTSISETKTSLEAVDAEGVTLRIEAVMEIAGKQLPAEPRIVRQGFHGDTVPGKVAVKSVGMSQVVIEGQTIACHVEQSESNGSQGKTVTRTYYTRALAPYVLRRESKTTDADGTTTLEESTFKVISLDRPCKILPHVKRAAWVEAVTTTPNGSTVTRAFTSPDVPGGVICHTADEHDKSGRLVRRSNLVLVEFGLDPEQEDSGFFGRVRGRGRRAHRSGSY